MAIKTEKKRNIISGANTNACQTFVVSVVTYLRVDVVDRTSEVYYWCINEINCTGTNMSKDLLYALGEAEANMYLCSKELRPSENEVYLFFYDESVVKGHSTRRERTDRHIL